MLLRDTLRRGGRGAVARVVIRTRQHLALVLPQDELLTLLLLRFDHELKKPAKLDLPKHSAKQLGVTAGGRRMAETLVENMIGEWHSERYKGTYGDDLLRLLRDKVKHGEREAPESEPAAPRRGAEVVDLASFSSKAWASRASRRGRRPGGAGHGRARPRQSAG